MSDPKNGELEILDVLARLESDPGPGVIWSYGGEDLNANVMAFEGGAGVDEHVNTEVDVLMVGLSGEGTLILNGKPEPFGAGRLVVVPKGTRRTVRSGEDRLVYLTCHRRRGGLQIKL
jgi:quercetin dioxygenase-like cupin family protein